MKMGLFQVHTPLSKNTYITDIFHIDELYRLWEVDNAIWYIRHGACKLNGGTQPYSQRYLLRQIIADADSSIRLPYPSAQLRYGHETVLLPLVCLIGINGYDLETDDLEKLEAKGWWCSSTAAVRTTTTSSSRCCSMRRRLSCLSAPTAPPITIGATSASIT